LGQALHILVGYEARPAGMQIVFWLATATLLVLGMRWITRGHPGQRMAPAATPQATA
jgi:high-affinity iron transporter